MAARATTAAHSPIASPGRPVSTIAMQGSIKTSAAIAVAVPLLALALPILDVGLAVMRRFVRRRPVFGADLNHIHHRLTGWKELCERTHRAPPRWHYCSNNEAILLCFGSSVLRTTPSSSSSTIR